VFKMFSLCYFVAVAATTVMHREKPLEHEHHAHHHPHGTGTRWLDVTLAVAATIVSLVSLGLAIHSGHAMEKLVAANSYPYLEQWRSMSTDKPIPGTDRFRRAVEYTFANNGVGPARIDWVQLTYKGKPMKDLSELLEACCAGARDGVSNLNRRGNVVGALVRPGVTLPMFTWEEPDKPNPVFDALHGHMDDIAVNYCYCSVFDECYVRHAQDRRPKSVERCEAPAVTFRPGFRDDR
jgi:hypothetical protein